MIAEPLRSLVVPIDSLNLDPANARLHPERNLDAIKGSLSRFGQRKPIIVRANGRIVMAGNGLLTAAKALGWTEIAAVILDDDAITATAYALADNRTAELAEWDDEVLPRLVDELIQAGEHPSNMGWDDDEIGKLLNREKLEFDAPIAEPPAVALSKEGTVYRLGRHILACGDSTNDEFVDQILAGKKVSCCFTDPPYGVNVTGKGGNAIDGDISFTLIPLMFMQLERVLEEGAWVYICGGQSNAPLYARLFEKYYRQLPRIIIWDKGRVAVMRHNGYHSCYEMIYYTFKPGGGTRWFGERTSDFADDIWREVVESGDARIHPTQKPTSLAHRAFLNSCPPDGLTFDPFAGSGSTLIASEQAGRSCVAMEIDPKFCDVIRKRWGDLCRLQGKDPGPDAL